MKVTSSVIFLLFVSLKTTSAMLERLEPVEINEEYFKDGYIVYRGEHEIVSLLVPVNAINRERIESNDLGKSIPHLQLFFVEADFTDDGKRVYQGLYVWKDNMATKLLEHGTDAASSADNSKSAFFGAKDGIYIYEDGNTEKYGTVTDSIIQIAKENATDVLYILTEDHEMYKITNAGNKKEKMGIGNPREFVLDYTNNIYFYTSDNIVKVYTREGVKRIQGLPSNYSSLKLIKPLLTVHYNGVPLIVDNNMYIVYSNGSSEYFPLKFDPKYKPTAYGSEAFTLQYHAYKKNIYEYNLVAFSH